LANNAYLEWLSAAGFVFYGSCYCGGYTEKYKNADGTYEVHTKPKKMRYHLKHGNKLIEFGGIYLLKDKLIQHGFLEQN